MCVCVRACARETSVESGSEYDYREAHFLRFFFFFPLNLLKLLSRVIVAGVRAPPMCG